MVGGWGGGGLKTEIVFLYTYCWACNGEDSLLTAWLNSSFSVYCFFLLNMLLFKWQLWQLNETKRITYLWPALAFRERNGRVGIELSVIVSIETCYETFCGNLILLQPSRGIVFIHNRTFRTFRGAYPVSFGRGLYGRVLARRSGTKIHTHIRLTANQHLLA